MLTIICALKRKFFKPHFKLISNVKILKKLYAEFKEHSRILESIFDAIRISKDDFSGDEATNNIYKLKYTKY